MWLVAAQSVTIWYNATPNDTVLLENIYEKVDTYQQTKPQKLVTIEEKLPELISLFRPQSKEHYILSAIHGYVRSTLYPFMESTISPGIVTSLADQFS